MIFSHLNEPEGILLKKKQFPAWFDKYHRQECRWIIDLNKEAYEALKEIAPDMNDLDESWPFSSSKNVLHLMFSRQQIQSTKIASPVHNFRFPLQPPSA